MTATLCGVICFTPTATSETGFCPPSATQSATGMSRGTGIAVFALIGRSTGLASRMMADCSLAFAKIGPVMVGGRRVLLTLVRVVAIATVSFRE
jgi:hypothetical protein